MLVDTVMFSPGELLPECERHGFGGSGRMMGGNLLISLFTAVKPDECCSVGSPCGRRGSSNIGESVRGSRMSAA